MSLQGRRIILGITGGIAAYKATEICRGLIKRGAEVRVIMTPLAKEFITPLTMATLSKNPILVEFFDPENGAWNSHISLGEWADCLLIAPATANTIAKMAHGIADNLLLTTYLSARSPVVIAPAMDLDMFAHTTTTRNIQSLKEMGVGIIEPTSGELASGLVGKGRMAEPCDIVDHIERMLAEKSSQEADPQKKKRLAGRKFIVTAGATIEKIDPVRFLSNHSSGKMGYAIAQAILNEGARVTLISGRTALTPPQGAEVIDVLTASEMYDAAVEHFSDADGAVMCAAVADYTPLNISDTKIKKGDGDMTITLTRTKDIAAALCADKQDRIVVGFALETDNELDNAQSKLTRKGFDFVVLNSLRNKGAGFRGDTNQVTFVDREGIEPLELLSKDEVARAIVDKITKISK